MVEVSTKNADAYAKDLVESDSEGEIERERCRALSNAKYINYRYVLAS